MAGQGKYDLAYMSLDDLLEDTSAPAAGDFILRYDASAGAFKKVDATDANAMSTGSASVVNITAASASLTAAEHANRTVIINRAAGTALTLPAATGTGDVYRVIVGTTITSNSSTIKAASASDSFVGIALGVDTDVEGATGYTWNADSGDDTFTMDGSAQGGIAGDMIELIDYATGVWRVTGYITQSGGSEATPFSATVS